MNKSGRWKVWSDGRIFDAQWRVKKLNIGILRIHIVFMRIGYGSCTWEPIDGLHCHELIAAFERKQVNKRVKLFVIFPKNLI